MHLCAHCARWPLACATLAVQCTSKFHAAELLGTSSWPTKHTALRPFEAPFFRKSPVAHGAHARFRILISREPWTSGTLSSVQTFRLNNAVPFPWAIRGTLFPRFVLDDSDKLSVVPTLSVTRDIPAVHIALAARASLGRTSCA